MNFKTLQPKLMLMSLFFYFQTFYTTAQTNNYDIGVGISDITGQIAQSNFFGYGNPFFSNAGIKDRQYARAYIIKEPDGNSVVFVSIDKGATFQSVNLAVLEKLQGQYGTLYTDTNVIISATHTHVSPGGYSHYELYNTSSGGFYKTNFNVLVNGIVNAIQQAHNSLAPGRIYYNKGTLTNASINRSLVAYNLNKDAHEFPSIDEEMTVLKLIQGDTPIGMISWFGVHPTNLSKKYKYCSGDNKGYASLKFERLQQSSYGKGTTTFVAAFANTNAGDMSPNLNQPSPNDLYSDATGPGNNEEESSEIIGNRQFEKALELYNNASEQLIGPVKAVSRYSDYSNLSIAPKFTDGHWRSTCKAALGLSFRAGAEDGRSGIGREGQTRSNPTSGSSNAQCHLEKPIDILFNIGANTNNPRTPKILPTSLFKIGQLGILAAPAEFTVMSGRRVKATVASHIATGITHLVFAGYSDAYAGYVTTREEYASQQYEGASTHFGPWTLAAYQQEFDRLATVLADPTANPWPHSASTPPKKNYIGLDKTAPILFDDKPIFKSFGSICKNANNSYNTNQTVEVMFWGAHPNNNPKTNDTYLKVQKKQGSNWVTKYEDRDTNTKFIWKRSGIANSKITIQWKIPQQIASGYYRIVHEGHWKNGWTGKINPYSGVSRTFYVNGNTNRIMKDKKTLNFNIGNDLVFPNPINNDFTFINTQLQGGYYTISNILGQIIKTGTITKDKYQTMNLQNQNSGTYVFKVVFDNHNVQTASIIKR
ncbi:Neutral ceramidase [Tenacibaculum sp. 190524A02b]|uniref:Neutral ceramidase n=1 Tax=Tenacibaculum vairaonense TaxID=3137860 RepID=A0ABP1FBT3_9FLAO